MIIDEHGVEHDVFPNKRVWEWKYEERKYDSERGGSHIDWWFLLGIALVCASGIPFWVGVVHIVRWAFGW